MHIPDGYLSPSTCAVLGAAMLPVWATAARKTQQQLQTAQIPFLAMGAAFSFTVMLFNIPVPGGTSAHAVGAALLAIALGPWPACVAVTAGLLIQALLFGDGGLLSFPANCFNLAFVMPFSACFVYHFVCGRAPVGGRRSMLAGAAAGYISLNLAALCAAVEFGLQPALFHDAAGFPIYGPYSLAQAVPAMAFAHLTLGGLAEGTLTALVLRSAAGFFARIEQTGGLRATVGRMWYGLAALVLLSPLGLLATGTAWGEWGREELKGLLGRLPSGLARLSAVWRHAPYPDYTVPGQGTGFVSLALGYVLSAAAGIILVALAVRLVGALLVRRDAATRR